MIRVAINGLGRIGRAVFKVALENPELELVAVNDLVSIDNLAYLLKYDTVYGRYPDVSTADDHLVVSGKKYRVYNEKDPAQLPWAELKVDTVFECTGKFTNKEGLEKHIQAGAQRALLSAPAKGDEVVTIVPGVNDLRSESLQLVSCASCTTNCITPVVEIMDRRIGVKKAIMTTVHAYTASQALIDGPNKKFRRGRASAANVVPTTTGAAIATTKVLTHLKDLFDGAALRVPVPVGSISDITLITNRKTSPEEINNIFKEEAQTEKYKGIVGVSEEPIVSSDIIQDSRASIVDLSMTQVVDGDLVKVMSWYDNEWGYANQMVRAAVRMGKAVEAPEPIAEREVEEKAMADW